MAIEVRSDYEMEISLSREKINPPTGVWREPPDDRSRPRTWRRRSCTFHRRTARQVAVSPFCIDRRYCSVQAMRSRC